MQMARVQFSDRALILFSGICMFIVHQSSDFMYQFINLHLIIYQSTIGVVVLIPVSYLGEWGSIPHKSLTFVVFCWNCPNFKGKNNPLPTEGFWKKLTKTIYK